MFELILDALHAILGHNMLRADDMITCRLYIRFIADKERIHTEIETLKNKELILRLIYEYMSYCLKAYSGKLNNKFIPLYSKSLIRSDVEIFAKIRHLLNYIIAIPLSLYFNITWKAKHPSKLAKVIEKVLFAYNVLIRSTHV